MPATAPHRSGATAASDVFSAIDSVPARAIPAASSNSGSRPQSAGMSARAASRSLRGGTSRSAARVLPCAASEVPPSTAHVATAVASACVTGRRRVVASAATPTPTTPATSTAA